ncbi:tyrosine-type recombinase/integrase [Patescibacteria group bacterium]|nr:tyrosine-type recombinase/integrase [Patescibacteria group bacterium]
MQLSNLITDFLEYLKQERNVSELTIRNYTHYLNRFLEFVRSTNLRQTSNIYPKDIDLNLIRKYRLYLSKWTDPKTKEPLKKVTQNYFMIALRVFLRYLAKINMQTLPAEKVELRENDSKIPLKILKETQLRSLLSAPSMSSKGGLRDRAILETLFSTGLRVSELVELDRDTINLQGGKFSIFGKGGRNREISLSDSACEWLEKYLAVRQDTFKPLFIRFQGKVDLTDSGEAMRLTSRSVERIVEKYVKKIGIPIKATPQTLRHCFAVDLLINGTDVQSVQKMLGHFNASTTQIYSRSVNSCFLDNE